jgi:hypothetical protein
MNQLGELWIRETPEGPTIGAGDSAEEVEPVSEALRRHTRMDDRGRYRPLTGARSMRRGWFVRCGPTLPLGDAIEVVYPLATVHRRQWSEGTLRVVTLDDVLARQTGRYEVAAQLSGEGRERVRRVLCETVCLRMPVWAGAACGEDEIPCPEPCSVLVSLAREAALWEHALPERAEVDDSVEFAAFDEPGNAIREAYLRLTAEEGAPT